MNLKTLQSFSKFTWRMTEGKILLIGLYSILVGLTDGISLLLLIPIAAAADSGSSAAFGEIPIVGKWLGAVDLPLFILLVIFVVVVTLQSLFSRAQTVFNVKVLQKVSDKLRLILFGSVANSRWDAINTKRRGDLQHVLHSETERIVLAISFSANFFQAVITLLIYMALAAFVSWQMALFASVTGAVLFVVLFPLRRLATRFGNELSELLKNENHTMLEFLNGIRLAKLFTVEDRHTNAYGFHLKTVRDNRIGYIRLTSVGTLIFQVGAALIAATFVWLAIRVFGLGIAEIGVLLLIFVRLAPRFNTIQSSVQQVLNNLPSYKNYSEYLEYFRENHESDVQQNQTAPRLSSQIAFNHVSHAYPGSENHSLKDVFFLIPVGKITALIGPSGSGKSTIADLVLGLTRPESGELLVDDEPITDENRRSWRSSVACVPQDAFLMNDTVENNLKIGSEAATEEEMWAALDQANIGDLLRSLPEKLQTNAGDRGTRFSGGERQRIALARALLRKPQLLVLDEATSALDWESQKIIADAIKGLKGKLTILTIAHRPSLILFADNVIALHNGVVTESGSFDELKKNPESFLSKMMAADQTN